MFRLGPDARKHEEFRAVVSAGGEDDFMLAAFLSSNAVLNKAHTDCTVTGEDDPFEPSPAFLTVSRRSPFSGSKKAVGCATPPTIGSADLG